MVMRNDGTDDNLEAKKHSLQEVAYSDQATAVGTVKGLREN